MGIPNEELESPALMIGNFVNRRSLDEVFGQMDAPFPQEFARQFYEQHDRDRKEIIEINDLLSGKKYLNKQFLMAAYEPKKKKDKKKKGGKKGRGGKTKI